MIFPGQQWELVPPQEAGIDAAGLEAAVTYLREHAGRDGVEELVIVRHGQMVWRGAQANKIHGIWSCTKSFNTTCLGLLIDEGRTALDQRMAEILPEMAELYPTVTLRHFASMTSGYRAMGDEPRGTYVHGPSPTPFIPGPPLFAPPGSHYAYWDSAMNQLGHALTHVAGQPLRTLFQTRIGDTMGLDPADWQWGDLGKWEGVLVNGGSGNGDHHVLISALGMARLGHLFLNDGIWDGVPLISRDWVRNATAVHVSAETPLGGPGNIDGRGVYGLGWWANGITPSGERNWPGHERRIFSANGHNNNKLIVVPDWGLVVVRLGLDSADTTMGDVMYSEFLHRLAGALR